MNNEKKASEFGVPAGAVLQLIDELQGIKNSVQNLEHSLARDWHMLEQIFDCLADLTTKKEDSSGA